MTTGLSTTGAWTGSWAEPGRANTIVANGAAGRLGLPALGLIGHPVSDFAGCTKGVAPLLAFAEMRDDYREGSVVPAQSPPPSGRVHDALAARSK